jgi:hypothetical protein
MRVLITLFLLLLLSPFPAWAQQKSDSLQLQKETNLVDTIKKLVTCKNMGVTQDGDLYCSVSFRGLKLGFADVNTKGGGSLYVTSLGSNQTVGTRGSRCLVVMFGDEDLKGVVDAHVLFRNDGAITHNYKNEKAWAECR